MYLLLFFAFALLSCLGQNKTLIYSWVTLDYDWQTEEQRLEYYNLGRYVNNTIAGIKVWNGEIYVTVPRWKDGVPSTLNKVIMKNGVPVLQPYPSWEMQQIGNPNALQYIQSMEIDSRGWMWILDVARIDLMGTGQPKLVIWDIMNNCSIRRYDFKDDELPHNRSFANDIVVDETAGFAYISDTGASGGLAIYNFNTNTARGFYNDPSLAGNSSNIMYINGIGYNIHYPADGIALTHDASTVYYCSLSRQLLFALPAAVLQNFSLTNQQIGEYVRLIGVKGYSDGISCDNQGNLFYGDLSNNAVNVWNTNFPLIDSGVLVSDSQTNQWTDTFAWDLNGNIYFVTNKLQKFFYGGMKWDGSDGENFRVWRVFVNSNSYLTGKPIPPSLPCQAYPL